MTQQAIYSFRMGATTSYTWLAQVVEPSERVSQVTQDYEWSALTMHKMSEPLHTCCIAAVLQT